MRNLIAISLLISLIATSNLFAETSPEVLEITDAQSPFSLSEIMGYTAGTVVAIKTVGPVVKTEDAPNSPILGSIEHLVVINKIPIIVVVGVYGSPVFDFVTEHGRIRRSGRQPPKIFGSVGSVMEELHRSVSKAMNEGSRDVATRALELHISHTVYELRNSPFVLKKLCDAGKLEIIGILYDPVYGTVTRVEEDH